MRANATFAAVLLLVGAASCADTTAPAATPQADLERALAATLTTGPVTYVLSSADGQSAPVVIFDHVCSGTRWVTTLQDTIRLGASGEFRRSLALIRTANGAPESVSPTVTIGRWQWVGVRDAGYSVAVPTIMITSATENGRSIGAYRVRVSDARTLVMNSGMGGSCPGSANDARNADFVFTRVD
ncbi:MAG: hypothetical protein K2R93_16355 [Gemmatimonadaceae bacterium]|nr:hypothetical protein [Gemmatimonadaceae bacterium]